MTSYTLLTCMATALLNFGDIEPTPSLTWTRAAPGQSITIDALPSRSDMAQAQADVQSSATLIDALRTLRQHVVWRKINWVGGRMAIDMVAESAIHANVATLALRRLFPGRSTEGQAHRS